MMYLELFWTFFKIGLFTFGGGYAMLPLIQSEVISRGWMSMEDLVNFIAISESTPGPLAINMATYIGSVMGGVFGSVCCTLGVVLPSFIVILLVAMLFRTFAKNKYVRGVMTGLKPAVVGLIGSSVISVAKSAFFPGGFSFAQILTPSFWCTAVIFAVALFMNRKKVHPIFMILATAALGIAAGYAGQYLF